MAGTDLFRAIWRDPYPYPIRSIRPKSLPAFCVRAVRASVENREEICREDGTTLERGVARKNHRYAAWVTITFTKKKKKI